MSSFGTWEIPGAKAFNDFLVNFTIGVSPEVSPASEFTLDFGEDAQFAQFQTDAADFVAPAAGEIFEGALSISFDVTNGQRFSLFGFIQAFGLNGGYTDGRNTFTTDLVVQGLTKEESVDLFQTMLIVAPDPIDVSAPTSIALFGLGLLFLRRKKFLE